MVCMQNVNLHSMGITLTENTGNQVLKKTFGWERNGGQGGWIVLHNMFCGLHSHPNIIKMIKSQSMSQGKWVVQGILKEKK